MTPRELIFKTWTKIENKKILYRVAPWGEVIVLPPRKEHLFRYGEFTARVTSSRFYDRNIKEWTAFLDD